jgi:HAD superfamily hydrolase (TIGR01509 family)
MSLDRVSHFIFDFDGTIVDTESVFAEFDCTLLNEVLEKAGLSPSLLPSYVRTLAGNNDVMKLHIIAEAFGFPAEDYLAEFKEVRDRLRTTLFVDHPVPRARGLEGFVDSLDGRCALATNKTSGNLLPDLEIMGLGGLFEIIIACDPPMQKKPAPDMLIEAAKRLDVPPEACAYIGDNVLDMEAAQAAGMLPIAMIIEGFEGEEARMSTLEDAGAALIIDDFSALRD